MLTILSSSFYLVGSRTPLFFCFKNTTPLKMNSWGTSLKRISISKSEKAEAFILKRLSDNFKTLPQLRFKIHLINNITSPPSFQGQRWRSDFRVTRKTAPPPHHTNVPDLPASYCLKFFIKTKLFIPQLASKCFLKAERNNRSM